MNTSGQFPIVAVRVTPIAFRDPPLLNVAGVHEPWALRSIIEVQTSDGRVGLGESYGDLKTLADLGKVAPQLVGLDPFDLNQLTRVVYAHVGGNPDPGAQFPPAGDKARASALAAFEVAFLDLQARVIDRPLYQLLGGAVRAGVPYSAYLFYKFARHKDFSAYPQDDWGEVLTPAQMVEEARRMVGQYGFGSIKLKGGVFAPEVEIQALYALRAAFPGMPLRIDPNGGWTVETTRRVMPALAAEGLLEYLEDPVSTLEEMGQVARFANGMPLATNMVTIAFGHIPETVRLGAVQVIRPPLLGWPARHPASGRDRPHLRAGHLDALQLAPRHQPGCDDPCGGDDPQPHLRQRHPLPLAGGRSHHWRQAEDRGWTAGTATRPGPGRDPGPRAAGAAAPQLSGVRCAGARRREGNAQAPAGL